MKNRTKIRLSLAFLPLLVIACNNSNFKGRGKKAEPAPPAAPACEDQTKVKGVNIAFVIDNSGSNVETDCQDPTVWGIEPSTGRTQKRCMAATNRETAVLGAYDLLSELASGEAAKKSQMAVVSFPKSEFSGYTIRGNGGWMSFPGQDRTALSAGLQFTRTPFGATPYGSGLMGADRLFSSLDADQKDRQNLAIIVSDGEPTDENPDQVIEQVKATLKADGIKVITIQVTQAQDQASRNADHRQSLEALNYSSGVIDQLIGENGHPGLVKEVSDEVFRIPAASGLKKKFLEIIDTHVVCE